MSPLSFLSRWPFGVPTVVSLVAVTLSACGSQESPPGPTSPGTVPPQGSPTAAPTPEPNLSGLQTLRFSDAPDRDLFRLTRELVPGSGGIQRTLPEIPPELEVGQNETFWLVNMTTNQAYQSEFELALVTLHAYWWVEKDLDFSQAGLERSAERFEEQTYPVITGVFGSEWNPGVDNDPHLNILNAKLDGVAGYFSSTDEYPKGVQPRSNQREIIYMNGVNVPPGSANYDRVIVHELQHAIHWNADASEDTWINEGLAELATSIAFDDQFSAQQFLRSGPVSLTNWPVISVGGVESYGAASLFIHFLTEHFGDRNDLRVLLTGPEDGVRGIDEYLKNRGYDLVFDDVFRTWAAANVLDGEGILGYDDLEVKARISRTMSGPDELDLVIPQYSIRYTELDFSGPITIGFDGDVTVPLLPTDVGASGCWWSNSGDSIDSTLHRSVTVPAGAPAALDYQVWFEIEKDWDYAYVEVSVDGGATWTILETPSTSSENPIGSGFGPGYTGNSAGNGDGGWISESVDLSPHAGQEIMVRFQYVTDDAVSGSGLCLRYLSIKSGGRELQGEEWQPNGFIFIDNSVRQDFQVQIIRTGDEPVVEELELDDSNQGEMTVAPPADGEELIVAVGALAEKTRQKTNYVLSVGPAN